MKAAVGRIVHVLVNPAHNNGSDVAPAIITRAWSDNCVNVRVLYDGPPVLEGRQDWLTSVTLHESREALETFLGERYGDYLPLGAFWAPRLPESPFHPVPAELMAEAAINLK
jgi:hypothetical protein